MEAVSALCPDAKAKPWRVEPVVISIVANIVIRARATIP